MSDNYDSGFDLVLSDYELEALIDYYETEALPDYQSCNDDDMWYGCQIGDRMFDLNIWEDIDYGGKNGIQCAVHLCEPTEDDNWTTTFISCPLFEENDT